MIKPVRKIAVLRALFLGDLLCSIPAFRALRRRFPAARISLIGLPWATEFVQHCPYIDELAVFPGYEGIAEMPYDQARTTAFLRTAQAEEYDLALQMHGDGNVSNGFVAALGAHITVGYRKLDQDQRLNLALRYEVEEHEVQRWLRLVSLLEASSTNDQLEWRVSAIEDAQARTLLQDRSGRGPLIALHAGAKDPRRRWPVDCFARLGDELCRQWNAQIVLTGNSSERPLATALQAAMHYPVINLCGATDLGSFAAIIARLDLLVSNDTGAVHLAVATGTRTVVLFGPSRPNQWAPLDRERHRVIDALQESQTQDGAAALQSLPVDRVLRACASQLSVGQPEAVCVA